MEGCSFRSIVRKISSIEKHLGNTTSGEGCSSNITTTASPACKSTKDCGSNFTIPRWDHHFWIDQFATDAISSFVRLVFHKSCDEDGCSAAFCTNSVASCSDSCAFTCFGPIQQSSEGGKRVSCVEDEEKSGIDHCYEVFADHTSIWRWTRGEHRLARLFPWEIEINCR